MSPGFELDAERFVELGDGYPSAVEVGDRHDEYATYLGDDLVGDIEDFLSVVEERGV